MPGHRFFFSPAEVEPVADDGPRILVAGIGNVFLGDDGFGVEVVREMARRPQPPGVDVVDFGIRGMDLLYALQRDYDAVVFVDAAPRGEPPGTVSLLEPDHPAAGNAASMETHGMDPVAVLRLAREICRIPARALVVACEPGALPGEASGDVVVGLSEPVRAAVPAAARLVESLLDELRRNRDGNEDAHGDGAGRAGHGGGDRRPVAGDPAVHEDAADVSHDA
ncbi:hydrogenase maturation protease [Actinomadura craniellae]|uniref:Hydrogenase maturation protease n=1 Tax=Actinomadura craniellae TaxID=2231787 RepID=A0A365HAG1_9ACTN|nr:hydrogenase maturation protease [Actinomadura craniellae]